MARFNTFTFVAKYESARKLVKELSDQGITDPTMHPGERAFVADPKNRDKFDAEVATYWNKNTPQSWRGQTLPDRAKALGLSEILRYRQIYSYLCWYSHSGLVGVANMSGEGLETGLGFAHIHAQAIFYEATNIVADQFQIFVANPDLKKAVENYQDGVSLALADFHCRSRAELPPGGGIG